ncbi:SUKH-4 family immunity protein [Streptomyces hokutonensis]|uniref:SUKH-4 family immunity protein n=1 Tax=Streptomyces hokutonensis TaxID=1306990 RepID=UPI0033E9556D
MTEVWIEVDQIFEVSLGELAECGGAPDYQPPQLVAWNLPEQGKIALRSHGLPPTRGDELLGIVGGLQESEDPEQGPDGRQIYLLGSYGTSGLAAVEGSGEVLAIPSSPQVHPDLAHLHPSGILPTPVNSTIVGLVECAWRWHSILPLLALEQERAGEAEIVAWKEGRIGEEIPDPYAGYQELCAYVLRRFQEIDPAIRNGSGFWFDVIIDVS